jgi:nitrogen fixation/metabolism regulation signal transduction histidine kinase
MKYEYRILLLGMAAGLAGSLASFFLLWQSDYTVRTRVTLAALIVFAWVAAVLALHGRVVFPLRTLSNLLGALREGDYSLRVKGARTDDAMGELIWEANALAEFLRERRLGALEATALLRKVLGQIDVALFGFDGDGRLHLVNDSGKRLLGRTDDEELLGCRAEELGLAECLTGETPRVLDVALPGGSGRWELRRGSYREKGLSHSLIFLSDLTRTLHEEERRAWKRLIRTVRHEVNNSLTPIQSVADSLRVLIGRKPQPDDWQEDLKGGLELIAERAEALDRFIGAYSRLMHLPQPSFSQVDVAQLLRRVAGLETRMGVTVVAGSDLCVRGDRDQLEQLLINVISNAVEASLHNRPEGDGQVSIGWRADGEAVEIHVDDDGPGLPEGVDVFVPFYTSKDHGSGIGLTLSRQIAEAHGGSLILENRHDAQGCRATLRLPRGGSQVRPVSGSGRAKPKPDTEGHAGLMVSAGTPSFQACRLDSPPMCMPPTADLAWHVVCIDVRGKRVQTGVAHGNAMAGRSIRGSGAEEIPGVHGHCPDHAGRRHRRQYDHVQRLRYHAARSPRGCERP